MELFGAWCFLTGFFHLALCFQRQYSDVITSFSFVAYDHLAFISGETEAYLGSTTLPVSMGESESHPTEYIFFWCLFRELPAGTGDDSSSISWRGELKFD